MELEFPESLNSKIAAATFSIKKVENQKIHTKHQKPFMPANKKIWALPKEKLSE
jgi:hypothetical protein